MKNKHNIAATAFDRFMTLLNYVQGYCIDNSPNPDNDEESGTYYLWCFPSLSTMTLENGQSIAKFAGGVYVLEKIETIFIIKTFLPEQAVKNLTPLETWKRDVPPKEFNGLRNWLLAL